MAVQVTAVQLEVLDANTPSARVIAVQAEAVSNKLNSTARVHATQLEYMSNLFQGPETHIHVHASQLEYMSNLVNGPVDHIHVQGLELEVVSNLQNSPARVQGVYLEVLRSITDKARRAPIYTQAN